MKVRLLYFLKRVVSGGVHGGLEEEWLKEESEEDEEDEESEDDEGDMPVYAPP